MRSALKHGSSRCLRNDAERRLGLAWRPWFPHGGHIERRECVRSGVSAGEVGACVCVYGCVCVYLCVGVDVGASQVKTGTAEGANVVWKLVVGVCREVNEAWMMQWQWLPASAEAGLTVRPPTDPVDPQDGRWEAGAKLSFQGPVKKDPACRPARGAIHALPSSAVQCAVWRIAVCKYIHCTRMYTVL